MDAIAGVPLKNLKPGQVLRLVTNLGPHGSGQYTFKVISVNPNNGYPYVGMNQAFREEELLITFMFKEQYCLNSGAAMWLVDQDEPQLIATINDFEVVDP